MAVGLYARGSRLKHGEKNRPKYQGNLLQTQQKERNVHGGKPLRLLHGLDMNRSGPADLSMRVATGLFV